MAIKFAIYFVWNFKAPDMSFEYRMTTDNTVFFLTYKTMLHAVWQNVQYSTSTPRRYHSRKYNTD